MGQLLNERITDIVYHFCDLDAAFYLVYRDALYLTNVIDTVRDKRFNSGKLYYMCFARHFNSNMGYPGKKDYLNVRIEFNGELLSQRYKGVQVNSIPMNKDLIVNREQEDRLVTNVPVIQDAHQYITGIYICDPDIANESLINPKTRQPLDDVTEDRKKILYMMQKPQFYGKVYVFNDYNSFNNLGNFRDIPKAIENGKVVNPNVIRKLAVSAYKVDDVYTFDAKSITTIGFIYAIMQYGESKSVKSFFHSNGVKKVDKIWNKQIPLFKKRAQEITNGFAMKMTSIYDRDLSNPKELDKVKAMMRSSLFEGRIGSRLRLCLPGKMRVFYPYVMNALYGYMSAVNCKEFTTLISRKMKLACEKYGIPYSSRLDSVEDTLPIAVGENISIEKLKLIIENLIDELKIKQIIRESTNSLLLEDKTVTFNGQVNPKYGWAVFICGASGSGKSTAAKQHIPIQGKVLSSDYFREAYADLLNVRNNDLKYNFRNYGPMKFIKKKTEPNKQDKSGRWTGGHGFLQQLVGGIENSITTSKSGIRPNLIIDTLGVTKGATDWMFDTLKRIGGYKISFVWVLTNKDVAFVNNTQRDVIVPPDYLLRKHNQSLGYDLTDDAYSMQNIFDQYSDVIDEAWIIVNSSFDDVDGQRVYRRPNQMENQSNVIKLQKINGVFQVPQTFGTDERKPFMGGRQNVSMRDITGDRVKTTKGGGVGYPEIYSKYIGSDGKPHIAPTDDTLNNIASTNPNNRILKNVDISHDANGIANRTNSKLNRLKNGQRGVSHSSLM